MKKFICFFLIFIISILSIGCKKVDKSKNMEVVILVENNKIPIMDNLNKILDKYKEKNSNVDLKIITKDDIKGTLAQKELKPDILITSRCSFIEIFKQNELQAIDEIIKEEKYNENFYNINSSSARLQDKYYGIGVFPYTIDFLYNDKALEKLNIKIPENSEDLLNLLKEINSKNIRIPYVLPSDLTLELALSSYAANFLLLPTQLQEIYGENKEAYKNLQSMNQLFEFLNSVVSNRQVDINNFYEGNEKNIQELENGDIPILIGTSYLSKSIKKVSTIKTISNINLTENTIFSPVGLGAMISIYPEGENKDSARKLFGYLINQEPYEELSKDGVITGNKELDMSLEGVRGDMAKNIINANENNVFYYYNIPKEYISKLKDELKQILNGNYDRNEWRNIIE